MPRSFAALFPRLYDLVVAPAERGRLGRWRRRVVAPAEGRVLEIGAGTGLDFPHYRPGTRVVATDPDLAMLARARSRAAASAAGIVLVAADAEHLPFRDGTFDETVAGLVLCTIPSPARALAEVARVLAPGGRLRMLEHVLVRQPAAAAAQRLLTPLWRRVADGCHLDRDTVAEVRRAGFAVEALREHAGGLVVEVEARAPQAGASSAS